MGPTARDLTWPRLVICALLLVCSPAAAGRPRRPPMGPWTGAARQAAHAVAAHGAHNAAAAPHPLQLRGEPAPLEQCQERWRTATLDHFTWTAPCEVPGARSFNQRYYVCTRYWDKRKGPIFFYAGNEADVQLYLNHTGLMFESAPEFGALLVFAEHRYYGASKPFGADTRKHMGWLTTEQALADYADLISELKDEMSVPDAPVIVFGGSYGGMLAAWFRIKYPHIVDGAIAASAPIWNFYGEDPPFDAGSFAEGVTYDATPAAGAPASCAPRVRRAWKKTAQLGASEEGRATLRKALRLCDDVELKDQDAVEELREWLASAWDYLAMGNYPYRSGYMLNGNGELPAFPVRVACRHVARAPDDEKGLLEGIAAAAGVFYNYSGTLACLNPGFGPNPESDEDLNGWDYQWCTEMLMPASKDGRNDMFWREPFNLTEAVENCNATWGVAPSKLKAQTEWGGRRIEAASNIVFSNGLYDPWHGGGVLEDVNESVVALIIEDGAHHLDLMFSHPDDPRSVKRVRREELRHIRRWVREARAAAAARGRSRRRRGGAPAPGGAGGSQLAAAGEAAGAGSGGAVAAS